MNTINIIGQVFLLIAGAIIIVILFKLFKQVNYIPAVKAAKTSISLARDSYCNAEVQRILIRIKIELLSCKVFLARFHNGGVYANGLDMKKHTVTHETAGGTCDGTSMMDKCVGVLNSRYGIAFEMLAATHQYVVNDVTDCLDQNFRADMDRYGYRACYLFLIKQIDGLDEGFMAVFFKDTKVLTPEQRDVVKEQLPRILDLVNMKENRFNT